MRSGCHAVPLHVIACAGSQCTRHKVIRCLGCCYCACRRGWSVEFPPPPLGGLIKHAGSKRPAISVIEHSGIVRQELSAPPTIPCADLDVGKIGVEGAELFDPTAPLNILWRDRSL